MSWVSCSVGSRVKISSLDAITRLLWPFPYEQRTGSRRRKRLTDLSRKRLTDLRRRRELLLGTIAASGKEGKTCRAWEPLPEGMTQEQSQRLIAPVQDYLAGRSVAGSHVLSLRATARALETLGKEPIIGDMVAAAAAIHRPANAREHQPPAMV